MCTPAAHTVHMLKLAEYGKASKESRDVKQLLSKFEKLFYSLLQFELTKREEETFLMLLELHSEQRRLRLTSSSKWPLAKKELQ